MQSVLVTVLVGTSIALAAQMPLGGPPGRLIDVGGYRLHIRCTGTGSPTVVIDGGAGTWSTHYAHIQDVLAVKTRVCTYDRAGLGWSDVGPAPRTSGRMTDELHALLHAAGIVAPMVLVGHSLGGYNVRIYQARHPEEVAAVVLVESGHPQQWSRLPREVEQLARSGPAMFHARADEAQRGTLTRDRVEREVSTTLPQATRDALVAAYLTPKPYLAAADEFAAALESTIDVPRKGLGSVPLVVLSARNSYRDFEGTGVPVAEADRVWLALQRELAALSTDATHLFSDGTHSLHDTDPDAFVAAIGNAVDRVRRLPPPPPVLGLHSRALPATSTPETDALLARLETAYNAMDAEAFVQLFSDDVVQLDIARRVHITGKSAWLAQTRDVNASHVAMARRHRGRARVGDWVVVEVEWSGTIRGAVVGTPGEDRDYRYAGLGLLRVQNAVIYEQILYGDIDTLRDHIRPPR